MPDFGAELERTGGSGMASGAEDWAEGRAHDRLCARLRGEVLPISPAMIHEARHHRIHLVLASRADPHELEAAGSAGAELRAELRRAAALEIVRERVLRDLLERFAAAGVEVLLLKGAGLAHTVYERPHLRPRTDLDVMIARGALERAARAMEDAGWMRTAEPDGELATSQRHYELVGPAAVTEALDVHWKIAIPQLFAEAIRFEELLSRAFVVTALGSNARTLSTPDALFVACVHRVAHHGDAVDLLWLWDIHLLASRLSGEERTLFTSLAARASMRAVCARGLELASARFRTPGVPDLIGRLRSLPPESFEREPSARFLGGRLRQVDLLRSDLQALGAWRARLALVGEHLFPPAAYMRSAYPRCHAALLPLAYLHRIVRGAPQWFRRSS